MHTHTYKLYVLSLLTSLFLQASDSTQTVGSFQTSLLGNTSMEIGSKQLLLQPQASSKPYSWNIYRVRNNEVSSFPHTIRSTNLSEITHTQEPNIVDGDALLIDGEIGNDKKRIQKCYALHTVPTSAIYVNDTGLTVSDSAESEFFEGKECSDEILEALARYLKEISHS